MEGIDRAQSHRSGGGSEFFICFTARPSSSASASSSSTMRVPSSKSLMSPGRGRDPAAPSLSASLSRRLRSSGSVKGGQSPMFPAGAATACGGGGGGGGRRKGCAFEVAEPSSPKVTCIGQVRVKSKKQMKKRKKKKGVVVARSRSQRSGGGEASFRRSLAEQQETECMPSSRSNQSWVYQLPVSICDALRALGSEFSCLLPCGGRSPCSSSSSRAAGEKEGAGGKKSRSVSSCAAVLARWLMAIQEEGEGKRGEVVGLVVEEREKGEVGILIRERDKGEVGFLMRERDMVDPMMMEKKMERVLAVDMAEKNQEVVVLEEEKEEGGRVSVCIPPRNALLLMRCRSDPVRVAALADRFWGSPDAAKVPCQEEQGHREATEEEDLQHNSNSEEEEPEDLRQEAEPARAETGQEAEEAVQGTHEEVASAVAREEEEEEEEETVSEAGEERQHLYPDIDENIAISTQGRESQLLQDCRDESHAVEPQAGDREDQVEMEGGRHSSFSASRRYSVYAASSKTKEWARRRGCSYREKEKRRHSFSSTEAKRHSFSTEREARRASFSVDRDARSRWSFSLEKEDLMPKDKDMTTMAEAEALEELGREEMQIDGEANVTTKEAEKCSRVKEEEEEEAQAVGLAAAPAAGEGETEGRRAEEKIRELPDCLLMMMYEPKLSMEVSRETWVCSNDFIRWRPHHAQRTDQQDTAKAGDGVATGDIKDKQASTMEPVVQTPPPPCPATTEEKPKASAVATPYGGPLVLTRCKSEPMRSSARLAPDACFWKNRHQPIGATGIGF